MKVCHLSTVHKAFDTRIFYKECHSIVEAGYDVYLIIQHDKKQIIDGIKVIPIKPAKTRIKRIFITTLQLLVKALKVKAKIYHFHDPELIPVGII